MSEPTFCGNRGRRCRHIFGDCDYHTDMGDALMHERQDRELEREAEKAERLQDEIKHGDRDE